MAGSLFVGPDGAADRYRLVRSIGRGGEAVLYLAEIELSGGTEPVVVKVLDMQRTVSRQRFAEISGKWNEQAELLRFAHRVGVVGVREHFEGPPPHPAGRGGSTTGRALCLVMNHVDGLDLRDWRAELSAELALPAERRAVLRTLEQLAEVLDWLHSGAATPSGRTVIHGDLSPGNVMVDANGQATLVDFGLSKLATEHHTAEPWLTPGFAAPEVYEGRRSPAADRYAFGALAYFLLGGQSPPTTPEELRAAFGALPGAGSSAPLLRLFEARPERRPHSLTGWVRELRAASAPTGGGASPPLPPSLPPPPPFEPVPAPAPRRLRGVPLLAAGAVAAIALGGAGGYLLAGGSGADGTSAAPEATVTVTVTRPAADDGEQPDEGEGGGQLVEDPPESDSTPLVSLEPVTLPYGVLPEPVHIDGSPYADSLSFSTCILEEPVSYNLGRSWASLRLTAGFHDTSVEETVRFTVRGDGEVLASRTFTFGESESFDLDVTDVLRLEVEALPESYCSDWVFAVGDPVLSR
ncbi:phosphotransferase [Streptomyces carpaticus]|uniref:protein kinase domain-containing protein n=1 Tax=Streptomyces carpaticus TaxID=285558 RepID=UPI0022083EF8|nr:phosphotransferase [Streptomyces carpaticus]